MEMKVVMMGIQIPQLMVALQHVKLMMAIFVLEDQSHLKILVHFELMELLLMIIKMLVLSNVEMV